jgi:ABC-2 type transport system ATP-binding protein
MSEDVVIRVEEVSKIFRLPHEKHNSLKSAVVNFYRGQKGYDLQKALENVSFEVKKGEFFGIVGRNGSGKSTLLKLLAGIYSPTVGTINISGSLTPFIELGVGFNQELTGRENVFLNGALLGFNRKEMSKMYKDIVDFAEIERFMDQKLKNYSSGMQVRLAFSIAIRARSDILLLDEVLAVGDAEFQQKCYNYFEELKEQNKTVVLVTHDMGAMKRFCTKAIYIDDGKVTAQGDPLDIADAYMAENIEAGQRAANKIDKSLVTEYKITSKIVEQTDNNVLLKISYSSKTKEKLYVGISVMKDGVSIAEISTPPDMALMGDGDIFYPLDTTVLNGGVYQIDAALLKLKNKGLLDFTRVKARFVVKGNDPTKGAAIKLDNTWRLKEGV